MKISATDVLVTLTVTVILAIIIFSSQPYLRLTYDSYDYIAASNSADNYLKGANPDGFHYLIRPPLMPLYLHFFEDKIFAGALLNILAFGLTIFTCLKLGYFFISDRLSRWLFIASIPFSFSFLQLHFFLWTEAAFSAIVLLLFYCIATKKSMCQVMALLLLAFLLRKAAGFIAISTVAVYIGERNIRKASIIAVMMITVFVAWEVFAFTQIGSSASGKTWSHHITFARIAHLDSVTSWILPRSLPVMARLFLAIAILTFAISIARAVFADYWRDQQNRSLFLFWFVYIFSLLLFWGARDFDEADRYLSVVLPFFMLTCFSLFARLLATSVHKRILYFLAILGLFIRQASASITWLVSISRKPGSRF